MAQYTLHDDDDLRYSYILIDGRRWVIDDDDPTASLARIYTPHGEMIRRIRPEVKKG